MAKKRADGRKCKTFSFNGRRIYVYGSTMKEIDEKIIAKKEELKAGMDKRKNPTFSEYHERWFDNRRGSVSENSLRSQSCIFKAVARIEIPTANTTFGQMKMQDITVDDLRLVQMELKKTRTVRCTNDYMSYLKSIFKTATQERIITYNPSELIKRLKQTEESCRDNKHRALSIEEQAKLFGLEETQKSFYYNIFKLAILTGMRCGEISALKYSDIRGGFIHVCRTVTRTEMGNYIVGTDAKTKAGQRIIPITDDIKKVLDDQKEMNEALDGKVIKMDDLLFKSVRRGIMHSSRVDAELGKLCKLAGIEHFTMHGFRHTFATRAIESGMSIKTLQELLGHTDYSLTMSLYGHCLPDTKKAEMDRLKIVI